MNLYILLTDYCWEHCHQYLAEVKVAGHGSVIEECHLIESHLNLNLLSFSFVLKDGMWRM